MATIANGGQRVRPRLIRRATREPGQPWQPTGHKTVRQVRAVSRETASAVTRRCSRPSSRAPTAPDALAALRRRARGGEDRNGAEARTPKTGRYAQDRDSSRVVRRHRPGRRSAPRHPRHGLDEAATADVHSGVRGRGSPALRKGGRRRSSGAASESSRQAGTKAGHPFSNAIDPVHEPQTAEAKPFPFLPSRERASPSSPAVMESHSPPPSTKAPPALARIDDRVLRAGL